MWPEHTLWISQFRAQRVIDFGSSGGNNGKR